MSKWWQGFCIAICYQQLIQDLMGKETYLKSVDLLWVNTSWWVWALLIVFFFLIPTFEKWMAERDAKWKLRIHELDAKINAFKKEHGLP